MNVALFNEVNALRALWLVVNYDLIGYNKHTDGVVVFVVIFSWSAVLLTLICHLLSASDQ